MKTLERNQLKNVMGGLLAPNSTGAANCGGSVVAISCAANLTVHCKDGLGCECQASNGTTASEKCCSGVSACGSRLS